MHATRNAMTGGQIDRATRSIDFTTHYSCHDIARFLISNGQQTAFRYQTVESMMNPTFTLFIVQEDGIFIVYDNGLSIVDGYANVFVAPNCSASDLRLVLAVAPAVSFGL